MKIRVKVFLGYALFATLVGFVSLVGYRATHVIGQNFDAAINRTQPVLQALQDISFQAVRLQVDAYQVAHAAHARTDLGSIDLPSGDHKHVEFGELDEAVGRYGKLVAAYFPDEADDAAEIIEKIAEFKGAIEKAHSGRMSFAEADKIFDEVEERIDEVLESTAEAAVGELREFSEYQEGVEGELAFRQNLIFLVGIAAILGAILGGLHISGRIARPVVALRDATRLLGSGRLDTRVDVADDSEVGELSHAFNNMAEKLSGSMISRNYVNDIIDSMAEGMVVVDGNNRVERVNQAFRALYRCPADYTFIGHSVADYFPDTDGIKNVVGKPTPRHWIETKMTTADGTSLIVALSVASLHSHDAETSTGAVVLVQDITERKGHEERLKYLALFDSLTALPNRSMLLDHLKQSLARQPWKKSHTAILFCDLDRFKFVNDTLGHDIGDILLQRVAERLLSCIRPGDTVARWSGDEFVVLLNDVASATDVQPIVEKVVNHLSQPMQIGPHELFVTVSVGVSIAPEHTLQSDDLIKCADLAMYSAKAEGKNTYRFYTKGMVERSQERMKIEGALRRALLEGGQLQVHYQAQQRLNGPLIGFEALVRWHHPELGLISPASFLPAAEEAGIMAAIDEAVMHIACEQAHRWQQEGVLGLKIAVNVSDSMFRRGDIIRLVSDLLDEYALPPSAIELELTEAIVMTDIERSIRTMNDIRKLGVELSIDDFGTGYSSLAQLKRCPIQMLKIDRSFVMDVMTDPNDAAITEAIIALAHKMGIQVIAEGVETQAQYDQLVLYDCDAMQGYLLSKPISADMLPAFLARFGYQMKQPDSGEQTVDGAGESG